MRVWRSLEDAIGLGRAPEDILLALLNVVEAETSDLGRFYGHIDSSLAGNLQTLLRTGAFELGRSLPKLIELANDCARAASATPWHLEQALHRRNMFVLNFVRGEHVSARSCAEASIRAAELSGGQIQLSASSRDRERWARNTLRKLNHPDSFGEQLWFAASFALGFRSNIRAVANRELADVEAELKMIAATSSFAEGLVIHLRALKQQAFG